MVETKAKLQTQKRKLEKEFSAQRRLYLRAANAVTNFIRKHGVGAQHLKEYDRLLETEVSQGLKLDRIIDKLNVVESKLEDIERFGSVRPRR